MPLGRICSICNVEESTSYSYYCLKCKCTIQKKYLKKTSYNSNKEYKNKIRQLVKDAKSVPCMDCGVKYPSYVMDLDHRRGKKKFNLSVAAQRRLAIQTVINEIAKCDVVCANCHRERTFNATEWCNGSHA